MNCIRSILHPSAFILPYFPLTPALSLKGRGSLSLDLEEHSRVPEDPWVSDRPARDPHDVDAGLAKHPHRILGGENVAAAEDRLVGVALLHLAQELPSAWAEIFLLDSSRM